MGLSSSNHGNTNTNTNTNTSHTNYQYEYVADFDTFSLISYHIRKISTFEGEKSTVLFFLNHNQILIIGE